MDNMIRLEWIDLEQGIVEAEAGIHLGHDPYNPIGISTAANSLLQQLFAKGWALNDLGGITHQTVSGFTATGSAGGSLIYDLDNVVAYRVVDGTGQASWIERGDPLFPAMQVHVGLMGIVTKIRLKCNPTFTIKGREVTTKVDPASCPIDLFGPGASGKPSLRQFLEQTPYSRILWWPQKGAERVVIWEATRTEGTGGPGYKPIPYEEFAPTLIGWIQQLAGSVFFVLLGNDKPAEIVPKLVVSFARFRTCLTAMWTPTMGAGPAAALAALVTAVLAFLLAIPIVIFMLMPQLLTKAVPGGARHPPAALQGRGGNAVRRLLLEQPADGQFGRRHPARHRVHRNLGPAPIYRTLHGSAQRHVRGQGPGGDRYLLDRNLCRHAEHGMAEPLIFGRNGRI
jgi:hypothetical protein